MEEAIRKRVSIRVFKEKKVPKQIIMEILDNGNLAPTAGNIQPWEFIIVTNKNIREQIVKTTYVGPNIYSSNTQKWMLKAPVFIVVCGNKEKMFKRYGEHGVNVLLYLDCSACVENMLLTVVGLGLSSCYVSGFRIDKLSNVLKLPSYVIPIAILPIGYSDTGNIKRQHKIDVLSKIHYETY